MKNIVYLKLKQNQKLSELRDWLLPMLMNGQFTVGDLTFYDFQFADLF